MQEERRRELLKRLAALSVGGYVAPTVALLYPRDAFAVGSPCIKKGKPGIVDEKGMCNTMI